MKLSIILLLCLVAVLSGGFASNPVQVSEAVEVFDLVEGDCDPTMCSNVCKDEGMPSGTCRGNSCDCSYGKKCSDLVDVICDKVCEKLELKGECDKNGYCICKAELEVCPPWDCTEQCLEDPRAKECEAAGGFVTAIGCLKYGPIRTCGCLCTILRPKHLLTSVHKNKFNNFQSVDPDEENQIKKEQSEYIRYSVTG